MNKFSQYYEQLAEIIERQRTLLNRHIYGDYILTQKDLDSITISELPEVLKEQALFHDFLINDNLYPYQSKHYQHIMDREHTYYLFACELWRKFNNRTNKGGFGDE